MKRNLFPRCFIAFSLSLCLGIPGQAREVKHGGCDGRTMIHRKPDDVVSAITALFHRFHKSCSSQETATAAITPKHFVPPPSPTTRSAKRDAAMTIDGLPSVPVTAPQMTHAPILAATQKAPTGWYEIELAPNQVQGLRTGKFPALALTTQTSKGFWKKREKTIATITPVRNGNFAVTMKFNVRPDAHSAVAIDLGQGNLVHIGGDIVARDGRIVEAPVDAKQYGRKQYAILTKTFLQKPAAVLLAIRKIAPIAVPAGIGFMAGGPVGAAFGGGLPFARNFISAKLMRLQMPQEEIMAPHVQYVLGDQQDKIRTLEQELAGIKKQLAALSLSAHETQTTKEGK